MRKPSFILVVADDLGYGDIGCDGGDLIRTPNIDRMAAEGVRFTDFYASANVCTPSRAGLLTGRYAIRSGLAEQVIQPDDTRGLPLDAITIPRALGPEYASALIGKWHLGHKAPWWPPTQYGFEQFHGVAYSHDMQPLVMFDGAVDEPLTESAVDFPRLTARFFEQTLAFAEANRDRPFFVLLALTAPHVPLVPNPDDPLGSAAGAYGEVVEEIDLNMGRLLEGLRALGLEEDVLVAFTSDNGPWFEGSAGPFRDRKGGSAFDGGFRVPFVLRQPGRLPAGSVRTGLASNLDLLPTLCAMARVAPPDLETDGRDQTAAILEDAPSPHNEIVLFDNAKVAAVRTDRWKYVVRSYYRTYDIPLDRFGYPLLFDMRADPGERYGLARLHPEIAAEMKTRVDAAKARYEPLFDAFPRWTPPLGGVTHRD